jgi:hypothetical protein
MADNAFLFYWVVRKSHYKATSIPKLHVMAIDKLFCLCDGFKIVGAFDDFCWARDVVGSVDKIDAI